LKVRGARPYAYIGCLIADVAEVVGEVLHNHVALAGLHALGEGAHQDRPGRRST
jgi:hypothetical protein